MHSVYMFAFLKIEIEMYSLLKKKDFGNRIEIDILFFLYHIFLLGFEIYQNKLFSQYEHF